MSSTCKAHRWWRRHNGRGRGDHRWVGGAEERTSGPITKWSRLEVSDALSEMAEQDAEGNQVGGGGRFEIEVVYVIDDSKMVGSQFIPPRTGYVRRVQEVVTHFCIVTAGKVPIVLPQPL